MGCEGPHSPAHSSLVAKLCFEGQLSVICSLVYLQLDLKLVPGSHKTRWLANSFPLFLSLLLSSLNHPPSCLGGKTEDFQAAAKLFHRAQRQVKVPTYLVPATQKVEGGGWKSGGCVWGGDSVMCKG